MGHKSFPCINIHGDHAKSCGTRWPLHLVGYSPHPKISRQLHGDGSSAMWNRRLVSLSAYMKPTGPKRLSVSLCVVPKIPLSLSIQ